jgi:Icc-related predicted phosphoesterase
VRTTRIFFTSDLHASDVCFKKFLNVAKLYEAKVLIVGGDITGKMIVPIVKRSDGTHSTQYLQTETILKTDAELTSFQSKISSMGYYPHIVGTEEMDELKANPQKVDALFDKLMVERVEEWVKLADDRLAGSGIKCFIQPGNDDRLDVDEVFKASSTVINPEGSVQLLDDHHEMISTGYTNVTPWQCPRDISEEELAQKIESMAAQVKDMKNCVFNFHCPPYDTPIDLAPKLDNTLKPEMEGGSVKMVPVGSRAVKKAIENYQPLLTLHGHIHESKGSVNIGRTLCLNPGSEYGEGILRGAILDLTEKGMRDFLFTSG